MKKKPANIFLKMILAWNNYLVTKNPHAKSNEEEE